MKEEKTFIDWCHYNLYMWEMVQSKEHHENAEQAVNTQTPWQYNKMNQD